MFLNLNAIPEILLLCAVLLQFVVLLLPPSRWAALFVEALSFLGLGAAALFAVYSFYYLGEAALWFGVLEDQAILRLPRAAIFLAALVTARSVAGSLQLPQLRKSQVQLLLTLTILLCDILLLSRHVLLSCFVLVSLSWVGIFLVGLAFRGRIEGEGVLKHWSQASLLVGISFGSILVLALYVGGLQFERVADHIQSLPANSPESLFLALALFSPFFLAGGIFPYHFSLLDRDQGATWAVQQLLAVVVQGAVFLSVWTMATIVWRGAGVSSGMHLIQMAGLVGGAWLCFFSITQTSSRRIFSALVGAQWSLILLAGAQPTALGVKAVVFAFVATFLWTSLLGFVWSRLQESVGGDDISLVYGAARLCRTSGLFLVAALASPFLVPGFAGFPAVLHLFAAIVEQKSIFLLFSGAALIALLCLTCLRIAADLLFVEPAQQSEGKKIARYGVLDHASIFLVVASILVLGILWPKIFMLIGEAAKPFH